LQQITGGDITADTTPDRPPGARFQSKTPGVPDISDVVCTTPWDEAVHGPLKSLLDNACSYAEDCTVGKIIRDPGRQHDQQRRRHARPDVRRQRDRVVALGLERIPETPTPTRTRSAVQPARPKTGWDALKRRREQLEQANTEDFPDPRLRRRPRRPLRAARRRRLQPGRCSALTPRPRSSATRSS
jgi:hypothetical protein